MNSECQGKLFLGIIVFFAMAILLFSGCGANDEDDQADDDSFSDDDNDDDDLMDDDVADDDSLSAIVIEPEECQGPADPCEWEEVVSFETAGLYGMWGAAPNDIWAVGGDPEDSAPPLVLHFNGQDWAEVSVPGDDRLLTVWGFSGSDLYVGGGRSYPFLLHYDGGEWTEDSSADFRASIGEIWGSAPNDIYAMGGFDVWHYDGASWTRLYGFPPGSYSFGSLWGRSAADVYLATADEDGEGAYTAYFLRFDGSSWNPMPGWTKVINTMTSFGGDFWGAPTGELYYADIYLHFFDGSSWQRPIQVWGHFLVALWGSAADDVYTAGTNGLIMHFNGDEWCRMTPLDEDWHITDLWGTPGGDLYAVGTINSESGGVLLRCSPSAKK